MRRFFLCAMSLMLLAVLMQFGRTVFASADSKNNVETVKPVESDQVIRSGPESWRNVLAEAQEKGLIPGALLLVKGPAWGTCVVTVGAADLSDGQPMSIDSSYRVGPVTKAMVSVALLQMETEWKVRIDQTLGELLGDGIVPHSDRVTLRDCLFEKSGTYNYRDLPEFSSNEVNRAWLPDVIVARAVEAGRTARVRNLGDFFPSDTDYILAGMIAEKIDNKSLAEILQNRVISKAGLSATYFDAGSDVPQGMIRGYTGCRHGSVPRERTFRDPSADWAAGAVVSTPRDVLKFMETLFSTRSLLSEHANAWLFKYITDWDGTTETARGAGVMERTSIRGTFRGMEGSIPGYYTCAGYYLHGDTYILLFINTSDHPLLAKHLYDSLLRQISGAPNRMEPKQDASVNGPDVTLSWAAGLLYGKKYHVYCGSDEKAVSAATFASHDGVQLFVEGEDTYQRQVKGLVLGKSYFWRVDTFRIRPSHEMDNLRKQKATIYRKDPEVHDSLVAEEEIITGPIFHFVVGK